MIKIILTIFWNVLEDGPNLPLQPLPLKDLSALLCVMQTIAHRLWISSGLKVPIHCHFW